MVTISLLVRFTTFFFWCNHECQSCACMEHAIYFDVRCVDNNGNIVVVLSDIEDRGDHGEWSWSWNNKDAVRQRTFFLFFLCVWAWTN